MNLSLFVVIVVVVLLRRCFGLIVQLRVKGKLFYFSNHSCSDRLLVGQQGSRL